MNTPGRMVLIMAAVLVCVAAGISITVYVERTTGPVMVFDSQVHDCGTVGYGEDVNLALRFSNHGYRPLEIAKVTSSCRCVVGKLEKNRYEPHEKGHINVGFTAEYPPRHRISQVVYVHSNAKGHPVTEIRITGRMKDELSITPRTVDVGTIQVGQAPVIDVAVASFRENGAFEILSAAADLSCSRSPVAAQWRVLTGKEADYASLGLAVCSYMVTIQLPAALPLGPIQGNLQIRTSSDVSPRIKVPIAGRVASSIQTQPRVLIFTRRDAARGIAKEIQVRSEYPFLLNAPESDSCLDCRLSDEHSSKEYSLLCRLTREHASEDVNGVIHLKVHDHPYEDSLSIPYFIHSR